jgi:hypothetical protein
MRRAHELGAPWRDDGTDAWAARLSRFLAATPASPLRRRLYAQLAPGERVRAAAAKRIRARAGSTQTVTSLHQQLKRCRTRCTLAATGTHAPHALRCRADAVPACQLGILHALCCARLDGCEALQESVRLTVEAGGADALRDAPIGTDAQGCAHASTVHDAWKHVR